MRSVAVFKWLGDIPYDEAEDDAERLTTDLSRPVAKSLLQSLRREGFATNVSEPYDGEGGWHFTVQIGEDTFSLFTMWTGIGDSDEDVFAVQPALKRGCFRTLFGGSEPEGKLEPIVTILNRILSASAVIDEFQWLNDEEFRESYCEGKPLPKNA